MNAEQLQRMLRVQGELATIEALHRENDRYREALEWIVDHSQEFTQEIHGYKGYGQALGAVHDRARREVEPLAPPAADQCLTM
jgi:hypothetical protein